MASPTTRNSGKTRGAIICGTDFTDRARQAGDVAAALAGALGLPLVLVHALPDAPPKPTAQFVRSHPARSELEREAARLRKRGGDVAEELLPGKPDDVLVQLARDRAARVIVVASVGTRDERLWGLGSVAERTAQSSPVPTLVVRSGRLFDAWLRQERPLRVLVAFDFTVTSEVAIVWVRALHDIGPCAVTVAYSNWPPDSDQRLGVHRDFDERAPDNLPAVQEALERDVQRRIELLLGDVEFRIRVRPSRGDVADTIMNMADEENADLIVTGTRQVRGLSRAWRTSVSRTLLYHARQNVACVPVTTAAPRVARIPSISRVLVTTDGTSGDDRAIAYAVAITRPGGTVRLVQVVHPRALPGGQLETGLYTTQQHTEYVIDLGRKLQGLLPAAAGGMGITTEAQVVESDDVAKRICQEAERFGADVIVMGSKRLSGLGRFALGSVAEAVMAHSDRPVLVTRLPEE